MNLEFFILNGYGQFVWPAFFFTFASCLILYLRTKKELKKQEKMFLDEYKQLHTLKIRVVEGKKITKEALSGGSI